MEFPKLEQKVARRQPGALDPHVVQAGHAVELRPGPEPAAALLCGGKQRRVKADRAVHIAGHQRHVPQPGWLTRRCIGQALDLHDVAFAVTRIGVLIARAEIERRRNQAAAMVAHCPLEDRAIVVLHAEVPDAGTVDRVCCG